MTLCMMHTSTCSLMFHGPGLSENLRACEKVMGWMSLAKGAGSVDGMQEGGR